MKETLLQKRRRMEKERQDGFWNSVETAKGCRLAQWEASYTKATETLTVKDLETGDEYLYDLWNMSDEDKYCVLVSYWGND